MRAKRVPIFKNILINLTRGLGGHKLFSISLAIALNPGLSVGLRTVYAASLCRRSKFCTSCTLPHAKKFLGAASPSLRGDAPLIFLHSILFYSSNLSRQDCRSLSWVSFPTRDVGQDAVLEERGFAVEDRGFHLEDL